MTARPAHRAHVRRHWANLHFIADGGWRSPNPAFVVLAMIGDPMNHPATEGLRLNAIVASGGALPAPGEAVKLTFNREHVHLMDEPA